MLLIHTVLYESTVNPNVHTASSERLEASDERLATRGWQPGTPGGPIEEIIMRVRHIRSLDIWLMSKGNRVLYRGKENPWRSTRIMQSALRREGVRSVA